MRIRSVCVCVCVCVCVYKIEQSLVWMKLNAYVSKIASNTRYFH